MNMSIFKSNRFWASTSESDKSAAAQYIYYYLPGNLETRVKINKEEEELTDRIETGGFRTDQYPTNLSDTLIVLHDML
jgi:hypothetical protein